MTHIETVTVGSGGAASIVLDNIPATYTDLYLVLSTREASGTDGNVRLSINGSTANLTARDLEGGGSGTPVSTSRSFIAIVSAKSNFTASTFGNASVYIPNYTSSANKSISVDAVTENNATLSYQSILAGLWSNSAAITSLSVAAPVGNIAEYSSASLFGITAGSDGIVTVS